MADTNCKAINDGDLNASADALGQHRDFLEKERLSSYTSLKYAVLAFFLSSAIPLGYLASSIILGRPTDYLGITLSLIPVLACMRFEVFCARRHHNVFKLREEYSHIYVIVKSTLPFLAILPESEKTKSANAVMEYIISHDPTEKISPHPGGDASSLSIFRKGDAPFPPKNQESKPDPISPPSK